MGIFTSLFIAVWTDLEVALKMTFNSKLPVGLILWALAMNFLEVQCTFWINKCDYSADAFCAERFGTKCQWVVHSKAPSPAYDDTIQCDCNAAGQAYCEAFPDWWGYGDCIKMWVDNENKEVTMCNEIGG